MNEPANYLQTNHTAFDEAKRIIKGLSSAEASKHMVRGMSGWTFPEVEDTHMPLNDYWEAKDIKFQGKVVRAEDDFRNRFGAEYEDPRTVCALELARLAIEHVVLKDHTHTITHTHSFEDDGSPLKETVKPSVTLNIPYAGEDDVAYGVSFGLHYLDRSKGYYPSFPLHQVTRALDTVKQEFRDAFKADEKGNFHLPENTPIDWESMAGMTCYLLGKDMGIISSWELRCTDQTGEYVTHKGTKDEIRAALLKQGMDENQIDSELESAQPVELTLSAEQMNVVSEAMGIDSPAKASARSA